MTDAEWEKRVQTLEAGLDHLQLRLNKIDFILQALLKNLQLEIRTKMPTEKDLKEGRIFNNTGIKVF